MHPRMIGLQDLYLADLDWQMDFWRYMSDYRAAYDKHKPKEQKR